jgi:cold shock CspA family protein
VTGDGDFVRLVNALQNQGCRVDVIAFHNASHMIREAADVFLSGFLVPGLLPAENGRSRGFLHTLYEDKYYGFVTMQTGFLPDEAASDVFLHGKDLEGGALSNKEFARLKGGASILEFDLTRDEKGRKAVNATVLRPNPEDRGGRPPAREAPRASGPAAAKAGPSGEAAPEPLPRSGEAP